MIESQNDDATHPRDRKLGDEWSDWRGETDSPELEIDEGMSTFLTLVAGAMLIFAALLPIVWYLVKPRIEQFSPIASGVFELFFIGSAATLIILMFAGGIALLKFRRSLFPYAWVQKFLVFILPKTVWLGARFGISRDRVGNSFIKVHNLITRSYPDKVDPERLLILLPRCLRKEVRDQIADATNGNAKILTAGGGEQARDAISRYHPTLILALACERDLMSGIKDVAVEIPVLAIPNKRPEGPCKNTSVSLSTLDETLRFIACRRQSKNHS